MGHLRRDCQGGMEEESSKSSVLHRPTCEDPPDVASGDKRFSSTEAKITNSLEPGVSFTGKLKSLCPSLFFSFSSWEHDTLDEVAWDGTGCKQVLADLNFLAPESFPPLTSSTPP